MCRPTTCRQCGKASWAGCGMHVEQVLAGVPRSERCPGHTSSEPDGKGFWARLLGR